MDPIEERELSTLNDSQAAASSPDAATSDANSGASDSSTGAGDKDAKPTPDADSSTARGAKRPATLAEVVRLAAAKQPTATPAESSPDSQAEKGADASAGQDAPAPDAAASKAATDEPAKTATDQGQGPDPNDVPFHKHPRWQELVKREQQLSGELATLKPKAEAVEELLTLTGGEQGFANMRALARAYAQDPAAAAPMLETLLADARNRAGLVISSPDLKQKVADGELSEDGALEIEQARRIKAMTAEQRQAEQRRQQEAQGARTQQEMVAALNAWETNTAGKDPDYSALAEDVQDRLVRLAAGTPPRTADEAVQLAARAYREVKERNAARLPKPKPIKPPLIEGSSRTAKPAPKTLREVVERAARGG